MNKRYSVEEIAPVIGELVSCGKKVNITVTGNSMYPLFRNRLDSVMLEKAESYKVGDIVLYCRKNGQYVLHRIVKIKGDCYALAGDNETQKEYPVEKENIIARAVSGVRGKKNINFSALWYKFYKFIWIKLFFLRKILLNIIKTLAK